jgi:hypothetical protein
LPQDSDRLMERLICLLPDHPDDPWHGMSDQYNSSLWDIEPDTQVCGIGENETVIVDGFKGAMVQWSMFTTVQVTKRLSLKRKILVYLTIFSPLIFVMGIGTYFGLRPFGITLLVISSLLLVSSPIYIPKLFTGKLYQAEPCLFGIEGYVPIQEIEQFLFGDQMNHLKWSPYGSPLSRHTSQPGYTERRHDSAPQPLANAATAGEEENEIKTYPVEALDPLSRCGECQNLPITEECKRHLSYAATERIKREPYGSMKVRIYSPVPQHLRFCVAAHA